MTLSIFFMSSALLSFEVTLMRILQVEGFGNFTFSAITIALIGFGASGTIAYSFSKIVYKNTKLTFTLSSSLFIILLGAGFYLSWLINFDPLRVVWEASQSFKLLLIFLLFSLPFLAGSLQVAVGFSLVEAGKIYFSNLTGSFTGTIIPIIFMYLASPKQLLLIPLTFGSISNIISLINYIDFQSKKTTCMIVLSLLSITLAFSLHGKGDIRIMEYRPLKLALNLPDVKEIYRNYSPFGTISVLKSKYIRVVHGLSLRFEGILPEQLGIFIDGDMLAPFDLVDLSQGKTPKVDKLLNTQSSYFTPKNTKVSVPKNFPAYLLYLPQEVPYLLKSRPEVFLAGLGGRSNVERAIINGANRILVTEENPLLIKTISLLEDKFGLEKIGRYCSIINTTPRIYLERDKDIRWDIIEVSIPETSIHSISGIYSRSSAYNLTTEAIELYLRKLKDNGILSLTIKLKNPPRKLPKLVNNLISALKNQGIGVEKTIFIIRSWSTATVLAKKSPFEDWEINEIKKFCNRMSFDIVYYSNITKDEINRFNIVQNAIYYKTISLLIKDRKYFEKQYLFNISATTDNTPFFTYFIKLSKLGELFSQTGGQWLFIVEGGYLVIFITFVLVCVLSFILIVFPLYFGSTNTMVEKNVKPSRFRIFSYYSAIGIGYMLIELTLVEKFNLLIVNPLFSSSFTIAVLLLFSGLGAYISGKISGQRLHKKQNMVKLVLLIISAYFMVFLYLLNFGYEKILILRPIIKYTLCFSAIVPLAILMGMPFPSSIESLKSKLLKVENPEGQTQKSESLKLKSPKTRSLKLKRLISISFKSGYQGIVPWAWSVNGYFSVIASAGAIIIMASLGINQAGIIAIIFYLLAIPFFP